MRKVFVKNLILLQGLNLIIKPAWLLIIDRKAQILLGQDYSGYYIIFNLAVILNIILDIGIQSFSNTGVAADNQFFKVNFKQIILAKTILAVLYFTAVMGVGLNSNNMGFQLLLIISLNQILTSFVLYFRTNINGLHHYALDSVLSVSDKFFGILLCIVLYYANQIHIIGFALAQLIATGISFIIALSLNLKYYNQIPLTNSIKAFNLKELFVKSIPFALLFALMGLYTRLDVLMMNWLLPDAKFHCGIYAMSFRLLDAAAMFAMLFSGLLLPMFAKMIQNHEDVKPLTNLASTVLLLISIPTALVAIFYGEDIINWLYAVEGETLRLSVNVFKNILTTFVPMSLIFVFSTLLTSKRDLLYLNVFALIALATNLILNLLLIPNHQSYGASISSLITQSVFAILCIGRCYILFDFKFPIKEAMKFVGYIVLLFGVHFLISGIPSFELSLLLFGLSAIALIFLLKIIEISQILNIFKGAKQ